MRNIAIVGAGIVGTCTAWALSQRGHQVTLFEQDSPISHTSRASSKLLHGGLRYLETGQFALVHKALQARRFWLQQAPHLCHPLPLLFPIYHGINRPRWQVGLGLKLYDLLARGSGFAPAQWLSSADTLRHYPNLNPHGLQGAYRFFDAQMDDHALGLWVLAQTQALGTKLVAQHRINSLAELAGFDHIVNAAGPWVMDLRRQQPGAAEHQIDWVRGSHLFINRPCPAALMLPVPGEQRIFFVLPYQGRTLIGTTEVRQAHPAAESASSAEIDYLLAAHNHYHRTSLQAADIAATFSGVRPLLKTAANPSQAKREWAFERIDNVLHIYGGKWTTAQIQGQAAADVLLKA